MFVFFLIGSATAGSFSSDRASVQTAGAVCEKKAHVEVTETMILVECKKAGYARKLAELTDLTWSIGQGRGTLRAREVSGADFVVSVPKKSFELLKNAMLTNLELKPPAEEGV